MDNLTNEEYKEIYDKLLTPEQKQVLRDMELRRISSNTDLQVFMSNDLVKGFSNLSLNEIKLLRTLITQVKPNDTEIYKYQIGVREFCDLLSITFNKRFYTDMRKLCLHLMREVILIGDGNAKHKWKAFHWVDYCEYDGGTITIKLSDELKPYIIGLQKFYTRYRLEEIVNLSSGNTIKILELIHMAVGSEPYGDIIKEVYIPLDIIKKATNTIDKYRSISTFKEKVIDTAINEINNKSQLHISYREYKQSKKIVGFYFKVESRAGYYHRKRVEERVKQVTIDEYMYNNNIDTIEE